jgi:PAS domain S-box-containing protein
LRFGYYDIFLIEPEGGHIVYSVYKEVDFATSLRDGPYRSSNLAAAFRAAAEATEPDFARLLDYQPYAPSYDAHASFIASPIFNEGELVGVLAFQMPVDRIDAIMTNKQAWSNVGLGQSGEAYIIGEDYTLRNQSRFLIEDREEYLRMIAQIGVPEQTITRIDNLNSSIGLQTVRTIGTEAALRGETGTRLFPDYRGVSVLSSYKPLTIPDVRWVIMSEIDEEEAFASVHRLRSTVFIAAAILMVLFVAVSFFVAWTLTRPLKALTANARELEKGNLDVDVTVSGTDEIGELGRSFSAMRSSIKELVGDLEESNRTLEDRVAERTADLENAHTRIRSILENAFDAIITVDAEQRIVLFNPKAEEIFGYRSDEVVGGPLSLLLPEQSRTRHEGLVAAFSAESTTSRAMGNRLDVLGRRKDETTFPAEVGISKMQVGGAGFMTAFLLDITERKQAEMRLAEAFETIKAQKERMEGELTVAREIQMSMLPLIFPAFPDRREFEIFAKLRPAREVGGDFYDFFFIDEQRFCFCIGDVSDKGVPAALFMAVAKTLIKSRAMDDLSTASILTHVNDELSRKNDSSMFVTVFLGILDLATRELCFTNAGHNPPYLRHPDRTLERLGARHGPIVAAVEGMTYAEDKRSISEGDILFMYTDGVTEAMNPSRQLFGEERLVEVLRTCPTNSAEAAVGSIADAVHRFEQGAEQADDTTTLVLRFLEPLQGTLVRPLLELKLKNEMAEIARASAEVSTYVEELEIGTKVRRQLSVVLDELLNNIISYAYPDEREHEIDLTVAKSGRRLVLTISDDGIPFNAFSAEAPDIDVLLEERTEGGLGIHLVRKLMDEVHYQRAIGRNIVTLVKVLKEESA